MSYWQLSSLGATPWGAPGFVDSMGRYPLGAVTSMGFQDFDLGRPPLVGGTTDPSVVFQGGAAASGAPADPMHFGFSAPYYGNVPFSVELWVNPLARENRTQLLTGAFAPNASWWLALVADNAVAFARTSGSQSAYTGAALVPGAINHVVATYDGATMRIYVNGVNSASMAAAFPLQQFGGGSPTLHVGGVAAGAQTSYPVDGVVDDVSFYLGALSDTTISAHRAAGLRAGAPVNTTAPTITRTGPAYTVSTGSWTGAPTSYSYRWQQCITFTSTGDVRCVTVGTGASYIPDPGLKDASIRALVFATNADGTVARATTQRTVDVVPAATFTTPAANATVSGEVTLAATANTPLAGMTFRVDGRVIGQEDTAAPYEQRIASTLLANGTHTIRATGRRSDGGSTAAASRTITVSNGSAFIRSVQAVSTYTSDERVAPPPEPGYSTSLQAKAVRYEAPPDTLNTPASAPSPISNAIRAYRNAGIKVIWLVQQPSTGTLDPQSVIQSVQRIRADHPGTLVAVEIENESSYAHFRTGQARRDYAAGYAIRVKTIGTALRYLVPVWAIGDADNSDASVAEWIDALAAAVPNLADYVDAWTVHPYGKPAGLMATKLERTRSRLAAKGWHAKLAVTEAGVSVYEPTPGMGRVFWFPDDLSNTTASGVGMTYAQAAEWHRQIWAYLRTYPNLVAYSVFAGADNWTDTWGTAPKTSAGWFDGDPWKGALLHDPSSPGTGGAKGAVTTTVRAYLNGTTP